ncbi:hypothetical protein, partial [Stenomitos frigidus]|uniref:hypothetical protein n=1 Tax=Stenomitos frigidus TaxID=1886765 RepID=UPI001C635388
PPHATQPPVVVAIVSVLPSPQHPQHPTHRALAWTQDGSHQHHCPLLPTPLRHKEDWKRSKHFGPLF